MNKKLRSIDVDVKTAKRLDAMAEEHGITVAELVDELAGEAAALPKPLEKLRKAGRGPRAPSVLAEDAAACGSVRARRQRRAVERGARLDAQLGHGARAADAA